MHGLRAERCAHSWRNFAPDGGLAELLAWENALRPTAIFFYYQKQADPSAALQLVAAATVADAIRGDFPFAGLPVLARCYILPEFRRHGLYQQILHHRLQYCRTRFGRDLRAIHIGTSDERVAHTITRVGTPRFVRIGSQVVKAGDELWMVGAFLHFTAPYLAAIHQCLDGSTAPAPVTELRHLMAELSTGTPGEHALLVERSFSAAHATGWFSHHDPSSIELFLGLCRAIPLVGFEGV